MGITGGAKEGNQCFEILPEKVGALGGGAVRDRVGQVAQPGDANGSNADADDPAMVGRTTRKISCPRASKLLPVPAPLVIMDGYYSSRQQLSRQIQGGKLTSSR